MLYWLDLAIISIVVFMTWRALTVGLIRELVTLAAALAGVLLAGQLYGELAGDIEFLNDDQRMRELVAFVTIFVGVMILGQFCTLLLRRMASLLLLGPFDRLGGAVFGFAKGVVIVEVLLIAITAFPAATQLTDAVEESMLASLFFDVMPVVERLLPPEVTDALHSATSGATGPPSSTP